MSNVILSHVIASSAAVAVIFKLLTARWYAMRCATWAMCRLHHNLSRWSITSWSCTVLWPFMCWCAVKKILTHSLTHATAGCWHTVSCSPAAWRRIDCVWWWCLYYRFWCSSS